jgi:hypothetical protein
MFGSAVRKHGMFGTPEYRAWNGIKSRCFNQKDSKYHNYGGRGITVHKEWADSFTAFFAYVGFRPHEGMSLDRIDTNGNYEPGNVRWATTIQQANNKRCTLNVSIGGIVNPVMDWARELNIPIQSFYYRIYNNKSVENIKAEYVSRPR